MDYLRDIPWGSGWVYDRRVDEYGEGEPTVTKELFIAAHEKLMSIYLDEHPGATEAEAYDATADRAYDEMRDNLADMADRAKLRMKEEGNWPPKDKI